MGERPRPHSPSWTQEPTHVSPNVDDVGVDSERRAVDALMRGVSRSTSPGGAELGGADLAGATRPDPDEYAVGGVSPLENHDYDPFDQFTTVVGPGGITPTVVGQHHTIESLGSAAGPSGARAAARPSPLAGTAHDGAGGARGDAGLDVGVPAPIDEDEESTVSEMELGGSSGSTPSTDPDGSPKAATVPPKLRVSAVGTGRREAQARGRSSYRRRASTPGMRRPPSQGSLQDDGLLSPPAGVSASPGVLPGGVAGGRGQAPQLPSMAVVMGGGVQPRFVASSRTFANSGESPTDREVSGSRRRRGTGSVDRVKGTGIESSEPATPSGIVAVGVPDTSDSDSAAANARGGSPESPTDVQSKLQELVPTRRYRLKGGVFLDAEMEGLFAATGARSVTKVQGIVSVGIMLVNIHLFHHVSEYFFDTDEAIVSPDSFKPVMMFLMWGLIPAILVVNCLHIAVAAQTYGAAKRLMEMALNEAGDGSPLSVGAEALTDEMVSSKEAALARRLRRLTMWQSILSVVNNVLLAARTLALASSGCNAAEPPIPQETIMRSILACDSFSRGDLSFMAAVPWVVQPFVMVLIYRTWPRHFKVAFALSCGVGLPSIGVQWASIVSDNFPLQLVVVRLAIVGAVYSVALVASNYLAKKLRSGFASQQRAADWVEVTMSTERAVHRAKENEARQAAARRAEHATVGYVAHELRNPIHACMGLIDDLRFTSSEESGGAVDGGMDAELLAVRRALTRMLSITNDVLDVQKLQAGKMRAKPALTDVHAVLRELAVEHCGTSRVEVKIERTVPRLCFVDGLRLRQIVANGISNAAKYAGNARGASNVVVVRARVLSGVDSPVGTAALNAGALGLRFDVTNEGRGLLGVDPQKLFEPFSQGRADTAIAAKGTGLGLPITRLLARLLHGQVSLIDTPAVARPGVFLTTLQFDVPVRPVAADDADASLPLDTPYSRSQLYATRHPRSGRKLGTAAQSSGSLAGSSAGLLTSSGSVEDHTPLSQNRKPSSSHSFSSDGSPMGGGRALATGDTSGHTVTSASLSSGGAGGPPTTANGHLPVEPLPNRIHVLVVDDESLNRRVMARMLRRLGATFDEATDGDELPIIALAKDDAVLHTEGSEAADVMAALEDRRRADIIFLDIMMERVGGDEVVRKLRAAGYRSPIVACTGNASAEDVAAYFNAGFSSVLTKPFTVHQLRALIEHVMPSSPPDCT